MGEQKLFHHESLPYQFAPGIGYQPRIQNAGGSIVVKDLQTSLEALDVIVEEGEGRDSEFAGDERAHYFVFKDLMEGSLTWEVYNVPEDPTTEWYAELGLRQTYHVRCCTRQFGMCPDYDTSCHLLGLAHIRCGVLLPFAHDREALDNERGGGTS
jgi:hypothetical protein